MQSDPEQLRAAYADPANWNKGTFIFDEWAVTVTQVKGAPHEWCWDLTPADALDERYEGANGVDNEAQAKAEAFEALRRQVRG